MPAVCRFCNATAVAVFELSAGCVCFPADQRQALCAQHAFRATPGGSMVLVEDLTEGGAFTKEWEGSWAKD